MSISVYTDSIKETHATGSPLTLTIPDTIVSLRYLQASNRAAVQGSEVAGWIDTMYFYEPIETEPVVGTPGSEETRERVHGYIIE